MTTSPTKSRETSAQPGARGISGRFQDMTVKARLITMVAVLGAMWLISVGVAAQGLTSAKSTVNASKGGFPAYVVERDAYEGWLTEDDQSNMAAALASLHEPSQKELLEATLAQIVQGREQAYASLKELITLSPVMSAAAQATIADVTAYNLFTSRIVSAVNAGQTTEAIHLMTVNNAAISNKTQEDFNGMGKTLAAQVTAVKANLTTTINSSLLILLLVVGIGLIAAAFGVALIIRAIVTPLRELQGAAHTIAQGDVSHDVTVHGRDEIGQLGEAFGEMSDYLREMADHADEITAGHLNVDVRVRSENDRLANAFAAMSDGLREELGDESCLDSLVDRMQALQARCLADLQGGLQSMASGDLTVSVSACTEPVLTKDGARPGRLAEIFNAMLYSTQSAVGNYEEMRAKLTSMLDAVSHTSHTMSSASLQMATNSQDAGRAVGEIAHAVGDVAAGAERQVSSVESVRMVIEEVAEATRQSADQLSETGEAARQATDIAQGGIAAAEKASEAMAAVAEATGAASERISELGEKSERIGGIVATITGIAEQTNLLALNAAIEAARAGEQGRGFAVVAEEVRKLAEDSQQAAALIETLIGEIQTETHRAVEAVELGAKRTEDGVQTVDEARGKFEDIGGSVSDMNARITEVTTAMAQISASTQGILESVSDVAAVAEENSASTEEVSASTQETSASAQEIASSAQVLATDAAELEQLVGQFTLTAV
ncbi:MAG: methyl-accepting chemotaxis protein [Solirubrobacteraceae bacterium]|jgi:methyl-accepting chemotaxis protein